MGRGRIGAARVFLLVAGMFVGAPSSAFADAHSTKDCASIEEPFAYNECIAKFGPPAKHLQVTADPNGVLAEPPKIAPARGPAASRYGAAGYRASPGRVAGSIVQRQSNGRYVAQFSVGESGAGRAARVRAPAHWHRGRGH